MVNRMFLLRTTRWAAPAGRTARIPSASLSRKGSELIQVGERWSMVTWAALRVIAGTSVTAVAPLPMTTTRLPAWSRSSGQNCGCTTVPEKESAPSNSGVCPLS